MARKGKQKLEESNAKTSLLAQEGTQESADYDEISSSTSTAAPANGSKSQDDYDKCEAFRRIASAEEIEEMSALIIITNLYNRFHLFVNRHKANG